MKATLACALMVGALALTGASAPAEDRGPTTISEIRHESSDRSTRIAVDCTGPVAYTYYSPDPLTLVVDIPEVDSASVPSRINVATREVESIRVSSTARGDGRSLARLEIRLASLVPFQIYSKDKMREDAGEVEAAVRGTLPADLVAHEDIRGLVHCHTTFSDGKNSVLEMARGAEKLGMKYITITDHSPTAHYAGGLPLDRLKKQWEEIDRAQEQVSVRLLRGTESDILADGSLDYPDAVLEKLDVIIASIHNRNKMDSAAMTKRITTAMRKPQFKVWGHALGRYVLTRPPFACDVEKILDVIAESRAAVEINGDPHRLDMEPRWIREARKRDIRFVVSTDAHSVAGMENFRWGVDMARRGWVRKSEVLNTRDVDAFRDAVRP
jgi:histidinol phosphatase-like PHP family hydrolase